MKFLGKMFSFATDEDGLSLKDIVTLVVLTIWSIVVVTGLTQDYTGIKLEQFSMVLESATDLTVYVIVATLGLVATDNIANMLSRSRKTKTTKDEKSEVVQESIEYNEEQTVIKEEKKEYNSTDII